MDGGANPGKLGFKGAIVKVLIGYSMRSGSTLLLHIFRQHSQLRAYSDGSSLPVLGRMMSPLPAPGNICIKPLDVFFNYAGVFRQLQSRFDKFIWLARDPRDSYLSSVETWIAYTFWRRGRLEHGIDTALIRRWKRIYARYFEDQDRWQLVRYEDLAANPEAEIERLLDYLELPQEQLFPFPQASLLHGGDFKVCRTNSVHNKSVGRFRRQMTTEQMQVFEAMIGHEMAALGYL